MTALPSQQKCFVEVHHYFQAEDMAEMKHRLEILPKDENGPQTNDQ